MSCRLGKSLNTQPHSIFELLMESLHGPLWWKLVIRVGPFQRKPGCGPTFRGGANDVHENTLVALPSVQYLTLRALFMGDAGFTIRRTAAGAGRRSSRRDPRSEIRDPRSRASRFRVFVERRIHGMQIEPVHLFGHPALNTLEPLRHSGAARFGAKPIINSMLSCTSALDSNEPGE